MKVQAQYDHDDRPTVLPDDACMSCGTIMQAAVGELPVVINGDKVIVPDVSHLVCPSCDEVVLGYGQSKTLQERAIETYRSSHGLLGADEIRAVREQLGLTQVQLAALLQLGLNTVSRWEAGRNVQSGAMDVLLRLVRDVPGTFDYLKKHAA